MDFTREPIIETIITPKEGYKLVVRNSKGAGQEEFFVDAVEVVSFGHSFFFRSLERPKSFLVSVGDYEILEVRETRVVLKQTTTSERLISSVKAGNKENVLRHVKEAAAVKAEKILKQEKVGHKAEMASASIVNDPVDSSAAEAEGETEEAGLTPEMRLDRRRDRKRYRRRKNRGDKGDGEEECNTMSDEEEKPYLFSEKSPYEQENNVNESISDSEESIEAKSARIARSTSSMLIPPPTMLISETIHQYKDLLFGKGSRENSLVEEETSAIETETVQTSTDFVISFFEQEQTQATEEKQGPMEEKPSVLEVVEKKSRTKKEEEPSS